LEKKQSKFDIKFSQSIQAQIKKLNLNNLVIAAVLDMRPSGFNDLLSGKNTWKLKHCAKLAEYFCVPLDELVFGDKNHIEKNTARQKRETAEDIYMTLVRDGHTNTLGKLMADGFFKDVDIQYLSSKVKEQK
jgi:hypothetical protein